MTELQHYIDGARVAGKSGRSQNVYNPATGEVKAQVPLASSDEVAVAIESAKSAFASWSQTSLSARVKVMFNYREAILDNMDELAELVSSEHGKMIDDAKGSITRGLEVVEYACGIPQVLKSEFSDQVGSGVDTWAIRQPLGVCAGITPFNFPAMVPMWMYPMAIATGNTFVLKPSERDPSCPLRLAELMTEAGLPDGCLNVINGDKEAVDTLLTHPDVEAVSFVGSTAIGEYVYQTGAQHNKRVQALCGAKNHMVVMADADMNQVVDAAMGAAYGSAGERCMAISVVVCVGDETADRFIEQLKPQVEALKVGPYTDGSADMGPVVTKESQQRIEDYIQKGIDAGAELVVDGRGIIVEGHENGFFIGGCLFDNVTPNMSIYTDEIFGPVLSVVRAGSFEEALQLVNDHEYGNGCAIFTRDGDSAREFGRRVRIGMVGINVPIPVPLAFHSFGGWKRSIFGDHHIHGPEGMRFYTRLKTLTARWPSGIKEGAVFNFKQGGEH